jgi:hypothetical protein
MSVIRVRTFDLGSLSYPDSWDVPSRGAKCVVCGGEVKIGDTLITYDAATQYKTAKGSITSLHIHPTCAEKLTTSVIQDLAKIVDAEGFVLGGYMAPRADRLTKAMDKVIFAGSVLKPAQ